MKFPNGAEIVADKIVEIDVLERSFVNGADVYEHDNKLCYVGPTVRLPLEATVERILLQFGRFKRICILGAEDSEQPPLPTFTEDISPIIQKIMLAWLQHFLRSRPRPQEPAATQLRDQLKRSALRWTCDRPACTVVRDWLKTAQYPRQRLTLRLLGPRVLPHLEKEIKLHFPHRAVMSVVHRDMDTIHVTSPSTSLHGIGRH